jgi:hypothetical protein
MGVHSGEDLVATEFIDTEDRYYMKSVRMPGTIARKETSAAALIGVEIDFRA